MVRGIANSKIGFGDLILLLRYFFKLKVSTHPNELARTIDQKYHFELGQSLREIRDLLAQRYFIFDLNISFKDLNTDHIQLGGLNIWNEVLHAENQ